MIAKVSTFEEAKRARMQAILQKLINYTQPKPKPEPRLAIRPGLPVVGGPGIGGPVITLPLSM